MAAPIDNWHPPDITEELLGAVTSGVDGW